MAAGPYNEDWLWFVDRDQYETREMGEVILTYHRPSGVTHILNLVSIAMLEYLAEAPRTLKDLDEGFPAYLEVPREECPTGVVRRVFSELDDAGFIGRTSS